MPEDSQLPLMPLSEISHARIQQEITRRRNLNEKSQYRFLSMFIEGGRVSLVDMISESTKESDKQTRLWRANFDRVTGFSVSSMSSRSLSESNGYWRRQGLGGMGVKRVECRLLRARDCSSSSWTFFSRVSRMQENKQSKVPTYVS